MASEATTDDCMICLDAPTFNAIERTYMKCCGKPICADCMKKYILNSVWAAGCPHCRSTMDDMYAEIDFMYVGQIKLRINGHCENIPISDRALRRFFRNTEPIVRENMELSEWIYTLKMAMLIVIVPFLENEVIKNNPLIMGLLTRASATNGKYRRIVYYPFAGGIEYALVE